MALRAAFLIIRAESKSLDRFQTNAILCIFNLFLCLIVILGSASIAKSQGSGSVAPEIMGPPSPTAAGGSRIVVYQTVGGQITPRAVIFPPVGTMPPGNVLFVYIGPDGRIIQGSSILLEGKSCYRVTGPVRVTVPPGLLTPGGRTIAFPVGTVTVVEGQHIRYTLPNGGGSGSIRIAGSGAGGASAGAGVTTTIIVGTAVVGTAVIDHEINGNWLWEVPGVSNLSFEDVFCPKDSVAHVNPRTSASCAGTVAERMAECMRIVGSRVAEYYVDHDLKSVSCNEIWNTCCPQGVLDSEGQVACGSGLSPISDECKKKFGKSTFGEANGPTMAGSCTISAHECFSLTMKNCPACPAGSSLIASECISSSPRLNPNQPLLPGQAVCSATGLRLVMQGDGNLVLYRQTQFSPQLCGEPVWSSGTNNAQAAVLNSEDCSLNLLNAAPPSGTRPPSQSIIRTFRPSTDSSPPNGTGDGCFLQVSSSYGDLAVLHLLVDGVVWKP